MRVTPELSQWIAEQLARGCDPQDMIAALVAVGHDEAFARQIMNNAAPPAAGMAPAGVGPFAVPDPLSGLVAPGAHAIAASDRHVGILARLDSPRVVVFQGLLSDAECDALITESRPKLERSQTVDRSSGGTELNAARTSRGTYFFHDESALLTQINRRIAEVTRWPLENGEPLQILHYGVGAEYQPHYDYFDPSDAGTARLIAHGGQRVATLIIYLNHPEAGGATTFPDIGMEVAPIKGNAVFFSYSRPHPDTRTLHGGAPVTQGEKWIATRWMRERAYC